MPIAGAGKANSGRIAISSLADGARLAICAIRDSSDVFPPLKGAAAVILILWDTVEQFKSNQVEWNNLAELVAERVASIAQQAGRDPPPELASNIDNLNRVLNGILDDIKLLQNQNRNRFARTLRVQADRKKIIDYHERMKTALDSFNLVANVAILRVAANPIPEFESMSIDINRVPPPPPVHFYGRDEYVQRIIHVISQNLKKNVGARLAIRGPGGIGKTSVALAVFHHSQIESLFRSKRYFVHCEAAETALLLLSAIASALRIDLVKGDPLELVIAELKENNNPLVLVLDNAETCWHSPHQTQVRVILQQIASIHHVTLILTIRGTELPNVASWCLLEPLKPLSREAAQESFLSIAPDQEASDSLTTLLEAVECIPLAVTLLARVSQAGDENATILHERWLEEQTDLLQLGSRSREENIAISIKLSLDSQPMKESPLALRLLSIISYLPDGLPSTNYAKITGMDLSPLRSAAHTLKRLSLVHESGSRLTTLSPIRAYARQHHPLLGPDIESVRAWYLELADMGASYLGEPEFLGAQQSLTPEMGNLPHVLSACITSGSVTEEQVESILNYSNFLYCTTPDGDLLQLLLQNLNADIMASRPRILQILGDIMQVQDDLDHARSLFLEARTGFQSVGDDLRAAQCLKALGEIMQMRDDYDGARSALEEARAASQSIGDELGAAQCLHSLGQVLQALDDYERAREVLEEARREFEDIEDPLGATQCLQSIGEVMQVMDDHVGARQALEEARREFQSIGDVLGATQCLQALGELMRGLDDYEGARRILEEARDGFQAIKSRLGVVQCLQGLGEVMQMQDNFDGAVTALEEARAGFQAMGDRLGATQCLQSLGEIMQSQDDLDGARRTLEEARAEFQTISSRLGALQCLQSLGEIMFDKEDLDSARRVLEETRSGFQALKDRLGAAQSLLTLGEILREEDDLDGALRVMEEARAEIMPTGSRVDLAECLQSMGEIMLDQKNYDGARKMLEEAKALFAAIGLQDDVDECEELMEDLP